MFVLTAPCLGDIGLPRVLGRGRSGVNLCVNNGEARTELRDRKSQEQQRERPSGSNVPGRLHGGSRVSFSVTFNDLHFRSLSMIDDVCVAKPAASKNSSLL